jgi:2-C-methyl-D-erythritol 4-phosphate cytidylyltransferase/2-C-methyl-D-erythritol 2,4-cyclodiphosphate synthase
MDAPSPAASFAAVIVAAGKGVRAGQSVPKQFAQWRGKPLVRHSAEALARAGATSLAVAIPEGSEAIASEALAGIDGIMLITGGATRQQSVRLALEALESRAPTTVLIHDAARPNLPGAVIERLLRALASHPGAIPALPVIDSLARAEGDLMGGSAPREALRRVQTPQAFRFDTILAAHRAWQGAPSAGDDAQVARAAGLEVALVDGDEALRKLTFAGDFAEDRPATRVGTG